MRKRLPTWGFMPIAVAGCTKHELLSAPRMTSQSSLPPVEFVEARVAAHFAYCAHSCYERGTVLMVIGTCFAGHFAKHSLSRPMSVDWSQWFGTAMLCTTVIAAHNPACLRVWEDCSGMVLLCCVLGLCPTRWFVVDGVQK